jgi:hypothetical protein
LSRTHAINGLDAVVRALGASGREPEPLRAAAADFVLEGLCALRKISRSDAGQLSGSPTPARPKPEPRNLDRLMEDAEEPAVKGKKKYYN